MSPMQKSLTALAATAMIAGVGYATAQSTDATPAYPSTQAPAQTNPARLFKCTTDLPFLLGVPTHRLAAVESAPSEPREASGQASRPISRFL